MTNRGYSGGAGYGPQNPYMRPNYNGGGYDPDRYYPQGGGRPTAPTQAQRPDQPEYYDRPSIGGGGGGSSSTGGYRGGSYDGSPPPHDNYSFRPVDQTYK